MGPKTRKPGPPTGAPKSLSKSQQQKKDRGILGMSRTTLIIIGAAIAFIAYFVHGQYFTIRPLIKMDRIKGLHVNKKEWGSYRPQTYFGLRTRDPHSPLFGMMWYEQPIAMQMPSVRHWCDQGDGVKRYGWVAADGRSFGRQNVTDIKAALRMDWINNNDTWTARVSVEGIKGTRYSVIFYLLAQDADSKFTAGHHLHEIVQGRTNLHGDIILSVSSPQEKSLLHTTLVWDDPISIENLPNLLLMNTQAMESPNALIYQLNQQKPFHEGRFIAVQMNIPSKAQFEISYSTKSQSALTGAQFDETLASRVKEFNEKFENTFHLEDKGYTQVQLDMAKVALSNMLGGIGYWHGYNKVSMSSDASSPIIRYGPHSLFSAVPSRPFFPRGFLWDEGFHNILIQRFDPDLSIQIVVSWFNTMSEDGWIPREMILGDEAESKVPSEYVVQRTNVANPPSLFYVIDKMTRDKEVVAKYGSILAQMYPKLAKWYNWLRTSQSGPTKGTFRWRGRNSTTITELNPKTLASGLDDYPRASHPSSAEYHLDLRCWMALCSSVMSRLSILYGTEAEQKKYAGHYAILSDEKELARLHWSSENKAFFDYGKHSTNVKLVQKPDKKRPGQFLIVREAVSPPTLRLVDDSFGYNSLFPLMLRLLSPDSPMLKQLLDKIADPGEIWTDYGLRSVSKKSPYYAARNTEHDPPYWRGYIWINVNYMVLSSLKHYSSLDGPSKIQAETLFTKLKANLVSNMAREFNRTGFIWENYDDRDGAGRGSHPFNGWSSLILMIMSNNHEL